MIPMVDLAGQYQSLRAELDARLLEAVASTRYILGPNVEALEEEIAACLGARHAVACASGTDALHLALRAAGIGPGDEVITSPFTFIATAEAIRYVDAVPVFVDIDERSFNLDPEQVAAAITPRTRAIVPVHLFGQPADMDRLLPLAERRGLPVIEDCAQSIGARFRGKATGTLGLAGCFSFFPSKNLGAFGDGGLVTTDDEGLAERMRVLGNHGSRERYHHELVGYNSRLDELQAVILRVKLPHLERYNRERRRVADRYDTLLEGAPLTLPARLPGRDHIFHQYTVLTDRRDSIRAALQARDIAQAVYYPVPLHRQRAFAAHCAGLSLPVAESVAGRCLSLPMFPEMREEQIRLVARTVREALR